MFFDRIEQVYNEKPRHKPGFGAPGKLSMSRAVRVRFPAVFSGERAASPGHGMPTGL